jgi:hypothetical protein
VLAFFVVVPWFLLFTVGVGWAVFIESFELSYCEHDRHDSASGELSWSVLPPGPVCTWTVEENGFADTRGPTPVMSLWLLSLLGLGYVTVLAVQRLWPPDPADEPPEPEREGSAVGFGSGTG